MTTRKFYKTVFQIVVISEDAPIQEGISLYDLDYAIDEGDCSGDVSIVSTEELNGKQAADALLAQRSDPEFFQIDAEGNDLDD